MVTIPTLRTLHQQVLSDIESKYNNGNVPVFGKVFLNAMAAVQAGKLWLLYKLLAKVQKNIAPDTAEPEGSGGTLERWGRLKLGRDPFTATAGEYVVEITGTVGSTINAGTTFKSNDDSVNPGKLFILDDAFVLATATDSITLRALEAGDDSQLSPGEELTSTVPIAGVQRTATVLSESVQPLEAETIEEYREKVVESFRTEPQGGAPSDYRIWAADVQGVKTVYPYAKSGTYAEIDLYIEATVDDSTDGKGTPGAGMISDVEDVVELDPDTTLPLNERGRRPMGVFDINFLPVSPLNVDITVADFDGLTAEKEADIEAALEEMINEIRPFIAGADVLSERNDTLSKNKVISAVLSAVPGATFGAITLTVNSSNYDSYEFTNGEIPYYNSLTI